jgi:SAM-dependent methyltransferase
VSEDPYRWDDRVESWEEVAASEAFLAIRDRIVELAEPQRDDRVIDLGAGTGLLALALAPRVRELVAVDISERMLGRPDDAAVSDGIHNVETLVADLRRLPLEDESATLVVSNYAFHHLDDAGKELALRSPVPPQARVPGTGWRRLLLAATIVAGAVLAIATIRYAQPWVHFFAGHRHGGEG